MALNCKRMFLTLCVIYMTFNQFYCQITRQYKLEVKTSNWFFAGTDTTIGFRLNGLKNGAEISSKWKLVSAAGDKFEIGSTDYVTINSRDLGSLTNIEVKLVGKVNRWKLNWIRVSHDGMIYKAFYYHTFKIDSRIKTAYEFNLEDCPGGFYKTSKNGLEECLDRNECKDSCNKDGQICENHPGGYSCGCEPGLELIGDQCEDINECYSHFTCQEYDHTDCYNTIRSFKCKCKKGFEVNKQNCVDIDECKTPASNGCGQTCINTVGSYKCSCKLGYILAPDGKSCIDANKCVYNPCNTTTSTCFEVNGQHSCLCKDGYVKEEVFDHKSTANNTEQCVRRKCFPLVIPDDKILLSPKICYKPIHRYGAVCNFHCSTGYKLRPGSSKQYICDKDGLWQVPENSPDKFAPNCISKICPALSPVKHGYVVPDSCTKYGIRHNRECTFYCETGYRLVGQDTVSCYDGKYSKFSQPYCIQVPTIKCPDDTAVYLPKDSNAVSLGENYKGVISNMPEDRIQSVPPLLGADSLFYLGTTMVNMTAKNHLGDKATCSYRVTVKDNSPPLIHFCPNEVNYELNGIQQVFVNWKEPEFIDNVAIKNIASTQKNGQMYNPVSFNVLYNALDVNNNVAICEFKVNIRVKTCSFKSIGGGDNAIIKMCTAIGLNKAFCTARCPKGKIFNESPKLGQRNVWWCTSGELPGKKMFPDCVDMKPKINNKCPIGTIETYNFRGGEETVCGSCPRGTKFTSIGNATKCEECPVGTYQPKEGMLTCKKCPIGHGTRSNRNKIRGACEGLCPAGSYSSTGFFEERQGGCKPCDKNQYNMETGSTSCNLCPIGTETKLSGSTSVKDCIPLPKAVVVLPNSRISAIDGEGIDLTCVSYSKPAPRLKWKIKLDNNQTAPTQSLGKFQYSVDTAHKRILHYCIYNAQEENSGKYECEATFYDGSVASYTSIVDVEQIGSGSEEIGSGSE